MESVIEIRSDGSVATRVVLGVHGADTPLPERFDRTAVAIITQPGRPAIVARKVADRLSASGLRVALREVPDGEAAKTWQVAADVHAWLADQAIGRHDTIVGVGGGTVTDLAGFVAATWLRGVEVVHHPTTLLAAVDAAIGGKTGLNLGGKNLVGAFWHPSQVVVDYDVIAAVPARIQREGHAEAIKAGYIADPVLVELFERHGPDAPIAEIVPRAVAVKADVVSDDFREQGRRAILNFGHTIGHAVEYCTDLSHGEAVAVGMVAAAEASRVLFGFRHPIAPTLERLGLPVSVDADPSAVRRLLLLDKKRDAGGLRMVLLSDVGQPVVQHVEPSVVDAALSAVGLA